VYLQARMRRVSCPVHGVVVAAVRWARAGSRFTTAFEGTVGWLVCHATLSVVAVLLRARFDAAAARAFGRVAVALRRSGRKPQARTYDAMIAVVGLARGLPVHTSNPDDFAGIDGLTIVPVPIPE
jgi:hypothetical protein